MDTKRFTRSLPLIASLLLVLYPAAAKAQWRSEEFPNLKAGWNAIYLLIDTQDQKIDDLLAGEPQIEQVWRWDGEELDPKIQSSDGYPSGAEWKVWRRGADDSNLTELSPNFAYLIRVADGAASFTLKLTGKAIAPNVAWRNDGFNLIGFPTNPTTAPRIDLYLNPAATVSDLTEIYEYVGGDLVNEMNPRIVKPKRGRLNRGKAFWIKSLKYSDYHGPLLVRVALQDGLDFGESRTTARLVLTNRTDQPLTATLNPVESEAPPGGGAAPPLVPLLRREFNEAAQSFRFLPFNSEFSVQLPAGESVGLTVAIDRNQMVGDPGNLFASLLKVNESLNYSEIYLPVSARIASRDGLWIGEAQITKVQNQLQRFQRDADGNYLVGKPPALDLVSTSTKLANGAPLPAWSNAKEYVTGERVINSAQHYVCIEAHNSSKKTDDEPGVGDAWETFWRSEIPSSGNSALILARIHDGDTDKLHFRIFDSLGNMVIDQSEDDITGSLASIRAVLPDTNNEASLFEQDRQDILRLAQEILGYDRADNAYDNKFIPELGDDGNPVGRDTAFHPTAQTFPLRLIVHSDGQDTRLLGRGYYGDGVTSLAELSSSEFRVSAAHLPPNKTFVVSGGTLSAGQQLSANVAVGYNSPYNPFVHTYHPDHDNLGPRFEDLQARGVESFDIERVISLQIDQGPGEIIDPGWGDSLLTGSYSETIKLLGKQEEDEDTNGDGKLDDGEDTNGNGKLDDGTPEHLEIGVEGVFALRRIPGSTSEFRE